MNNLAHLTIGFFIALLGILSLCNSWNLFLTTTFIVILCLYLIILIVECSLRSFKRTKDKQVIALPDRTWTLLLILFLLITNISAFANAYIKSKGVQYQLDDAKPVLKEIDDAVYFSAVTLTTLGYGDFVPTSKTARRYVILQLGSGVLLLLFIFPIVASRLSDFDGTG